MNKNLSLKIAHRVENIKPSPTLAISQQAEELQAAGKPMLNLSVGEPDFDTPEHIKEAAIKAIHDGRTKYTAVDGIKELKLAIVNKLARENHLNYELNQILVSSGAKHSIYNVLTAIVNPGDEVIIPAPYWVSYPDMVKLVEGKPVVIETEFSQKFKLQPEQLKAAINEKTRAIILNSPSNPTGMAYTKSELQALGNVILEYPDIVIITDDIYEQNLWNHLPFANIVNASPELYERTIVINGVSKTYAMTGWRIGYAAGPSKIIAAMKKAQSQSTSNPTSISQYAAIAALNGSQECVKQMTAAYKDRHDYLVGELQQLPGFKCIPSDGTFYTFPSVAGLMTKENGINNDLAFAEFLLTQAEIAIVPGSAFGAPGYIRICYTVAKKDLIIAVERLKNAVAKLV